MQATEATIIELHREDWEERGRLERTVRRLGWKLCAVGGKGEHPVFGYRWWAMGPAGELTAGRDASELLERIAEAKRGTK